MDELQALKDLGQTLCCAADELLDACDKAGSFDNLFVEVFPDSSRRGTRAKDDYKRIDRARNEMKAAISNYRALIAEQEG